MNTFLTQTGKNRPNWGDKKIVALDPGETTGACSFVGMQMVHREQLQTSLLPLAAVILRKYIMMMDPVLVVAEDYRVYKWKTESHAWAELHTPKLIGCLQLICHDLKLPLVLQSAQVGKGFCTDERLKEWGFYQAANRHSNDAVRHACQWLMFGKELTA